MIKSLFRPFRRTWDAYEKLLATHTLKVKAATGGIMYFCGDVAQQRIEHFLTKKKENKDQKFEPDYKRHAKLAFWGTVGGGLLIHYWYVLLDYKIPSRTAKAVIVKTAIEQAIFAPVFYLLFFVTLGKFDGNSNEEIKKEIKKSFVPTFLADCAVWPLANIINFKYVPSRQRVLYASSLTFFWSIYLSSVGGK